MSKINQSGKRNFPSSKGFSLGNKNVDSIFPEKWNPNESKIIVFFPDCNFSTYLFLTDNPNVQKVLQDFSASPVISIGFFSSNDKISFIILCCENGIAAIDKSINLTQFLKSVSSTIISTNSEKYLDQLINQYKIKINSKEIESFDGYTSYIQSDRLGPNSKQILSHELNLNGQSNFTIIDVLSMCFRTVAAYHYFTTFCNQDKTAPLPLFQPVTTQESEQVKTIPLKLIPATSSTSPPSQSQISDYKKSISDKPTTSNASPASSNGVISLTTVVPNLNTNRPQSPPVLPKNLVTNLSMIQSRAQSPPQSLYQSQIPFHHFQPTSANPVQAANVQMKSSQMPQKQNQSKSPPAQFSPQQIVGPENRAKQRQQHVGSPPIQNFYPTSIRNWHSLTSDPSFSDSTTQNSGPEPQQEMADQAPIKAELTADVPGKSGQKGKPPGQGQRKAKQQQPKKIAQNDAGDEPTDWKPIPKSKLPINQSPSEKVGTEKQQPPKQQTRPPRRDQRVKCPLCPAMFEKESLTLNHFVTQHGFIKEFDKAFRYTKDGLTCLVCHRTMKCYDFVINHAAIFHYQLFEELIYKLNDSEAVKKFLQRFKNKIPVTGNRNKRDNNPAECQALDTRSLKNVSVQTDTPEDLFDDSYCNFIASSISTQGIKTEKIELSKFEPIEIEMIQENLELFEIPVDAHFWRQLDMLEAFMKGTDNAVFEDDHYLCKLCNVKCKSNATFLQHCFEQHRDLLDSFD